MFHSEKAIRVLVLHESPDEAEQIINALRNIGNATRATQIFSEEELLLELKKHSWDLLLARPDADGISAEQCLQHLTRLEKDIPTIVIADEVTSELFVSCMKNGAQDVVPRGQIEHLVLVILRELKHLHERRLLRHSDAYIKESERRCNLLLESSRDAIAYITDGMHVHANDSYLQLFAYEDVEDLEGMPILDMIAEKDLTAFKSFLKQYTPDNQSSKELECAGIRSDGSEIKIHLELSEATYHGENCVQIVIRPNVEGAGNAGMGEVSHVDLLTGLLTRQAFEKEMNTFVERALNEERSSNLLFIGIDKFQQLKVSFGIADADIVLSDLAESLQTVTAELQENSEISCVLARFSESEFTILLEDGGDVDKAKAVAESVCQKAEQQMSELQGKTIQITTSVGIATISDSCPGIHEVINRAHKACSKARDEKNKDGKSNIVVFQATGTEKALLDDRDIQKELQSAIDDGRFRILYQPIVSLRGDHREFYEVLLRLKDEAGKEVLPNEFLPNASASSLAEKIDRWVIVQALKSVAARRNKGLETRIIVNLTSESIRDNSLLSWLSLALRAARVPGNCLIFQMTENDATTYLKQAVQFNKGIKELHCSSSVSRFGGAINPVGMLKHLDADFLKLDASFTQEVDNKESRERLKELVTAVHAMEKITIAPHVENAGVLSTLWQIGISYIQGYYLSPPIESMDYDFTPEE